MEELEAISIQNVWFRKGDWVIARPNDEEDLAPLQAPAHLPQFGVPHRLWFGQVKRMFRHRRIASYEVDVFDVD